MSQSGFIAGTLLAAFILWLAVNDRLSAYTAVLWGDTAAPKPSGNFPVAAPGAAPGGAGGGIMDSLPGVSEFGPALLEAAPEALMLL